ncbi:LysR family transcriptional regulator [Rugosibacter aromaticivorans]|uniref:LysR family transcriptional regulator n=1 Tax=Rugosibacter aromaticivorans TaxID=1565605 RepID=UPI00192A2AC6|nr:LysR family transcriptional regulator [Rugosibacter aromaticivorans]
MNILNFDLNLLRAFDAMMAERNVTRAAQRVFLSQPATSHALARLRKQIGDPLFMRMGREMVPTAKAMALAPAIRNMLEQLEAVLDEKPFDPLVSTAAFRIGLVDVMEYMLAPMFAQLIREDAPHIRFAIQGYDSSSYQAQLGTGILDIAVGLPEPTAPGIHSCKLAAFPPVGLVRKNHLLSQGNASIREFNQTPRLTTDVRADRLRETAVPPAAKNKTASKAVYTTAHFFAVPLLLANSDLLLVTSHVVAQLLCAQYPLVTIPLPARYPPLEPHIFWHERTHRDPAHKWLREKIMATSRDLAAP